MSSKRKPKQESEKKESLATDIRKSVVTFVVTLVGNLVLALVYRTNKSTLTFAAIVTLWKDSWVLILAITFAIVIVVFIYRRVKTVRSQNRDGDSLGYKLITSSDRILEENYSKHGVLWTVWYRSGIADVEEKCYCPDCHTALEEKLTFWGKYQWKCMSSDCNFTIKQKESMAKIHKYVKAMAYEKFIRNRTFV